jgi:flagellar biosynthetic protein FlhB
VNLQYFAQEKTEEATPRKREQARNKGQVFKSAELVGAVTLLTTYLVLRYAGPNIAGRVVSFARNLWVDGAHQDWSEAGVRLLLIQMLLLTAMAVAPVVLLAALAGVGANLIQVGFLLTATPMTPKWERISPASGLKRLFSKRSLAELFKALFKMCFIGVIAYRTVAADLDRFPLLLGMETIEVVSFLSGLVSRMILWVAVSMLVLALFDYAYQRYEYEQSLRMTKQEVKDEFKQTEGNPEIRSRIKQKQREMARRRMMQELPKADVVVTNPTHYAVALSYKPGEMAAPRVLAKGAGAVALRIRELSAEHNVPIVENPPLARELFRVSEVGETVPFELYQAVAEVLAFVYQTKEKGY